MARALISLPFWVMAAWTAMMGWLLTGSRYQLFLAPKFRLLLFAGATLSLAFSLSLALQPVPRSWDHRIKGLFLLLPLIFILLTGDGTLGNYALSKWTMTPSPPSLPRISDSETQSSGTAPLPALAQTALPLVPISRLVRDWESFDGKEIQVEGLFAATIVDHEELSAVFRYYITCCAADALPVGVFLNAQPGAGLKNDDWVRATGRVRRQILDDFDIIMMDDPLVEKQAKPSKDAAYIFD